MFSKKIIIIFLLFLFVFLVPKAYAHDLTLTYTSVSINKEEINVAITTPEANILGVYPDKGVDIDNIDFRFFAKTAENGFLIENDGKRCEASIKNFQKAEDIESVAYELVYVCPSKLNHLKFTYNLFFDVSKTHENITDFYIESFSEQVIFSTSLKSHEINVGDIREGLGRYNILWSIFNFLVLGIEHILIGYDHILFLLALLISVKTFKSMFKIVSSFTLAHSITLIVASLGIFILPAKITESLIALSISLVALENLFRNRKIKNKYVSFIVDSSNRWIVAFVFGLIHGFGFSSVLREIGLPKDGLIASLLSFNVGVELGQVFIVSLIFPILLLIRRRGMEAKFSRYASIVIGIIGLVWFIQRVSF